MANSTLNNESGLISIKTSFILLLIGLAVHAGAEFIPPYSDYYFLKKKVDGEAKLSNMYVNEMLAKHILREANGWNMDLEREHILVDRTGDQIYISVKYPHTFVLFGGRYVKEHVFFYEKSRTIPEGGYLRTE